MKIQNLTLLLLFSCSLCYSQVDFRVNYYPKIYEAENYIIKDKIKEAADTFDQAFSYVKTPLAKDIFNAAVCKFLLNDMNGSKFLMIKLAKKGISTDLLDKKEIFSKPEVKKMWESFKPIYQSIQKEAEEGYILEYLEIFKNIKDSIELSNRNAFFTTGYGKDRRSIPVSKLDFSKIKDSSYLNTLPTSDSIYVKRIENQNFNRIKEAINFGRHYLLKEIKKAEIWPEDKSSFNDENFSENGLLSVLNFFSVPKYSLLNITRNKLISQSYDYSSVQKIEVSQEIYIDAIKNGNLNPLIGFKLNKYGSNFIENLLKMFVLHVEDTTGCSQDLNRISGVKYLKKGYYSKEDLDKFDTFKAEYGMDNLENLISKEVYASTRNQYFIFLTNRNFEDLTVPNCSVAQQQLFGSQILEE